MRSLQDLQTFAFRVRGKFAIGIFDGPGRIS